MANSRTRTGKIAKLNRAAPEPFVEVHPKDAGRYGVTEGDKVEVASRRGAIQARAHVTDAIREGAVFLPYHFGYLAGESQAVNVLTNRSFDEFAKQPEYKACAVRLRAV